MTVKRTGKTNRGKSSVRVIRLSKHDIAKRILRETFSYIVDVGIDSELLDLLAESAYEQIDLNQPEIIELLLAKFERKVKRGYRIYSEPISASITELADEIADEYRLLKQSLTIDEKVALAEALTSEFLDQFDVYLSETQAFVQPYETAGSTSTEISPTFIKTASKLFVTTQFGLNFIWDYLSYAKTAVKRYKQLAKSKLHNVDPYHNLLSEYFEEVEDENDERHILKTLSFNIVRDAIDYYKNQYLKQQDRNTIDIFPALSR